MIVTAAPRQAVDEAIKLFVAEMKAQGVWCAGSTAPAAVPACKFVQVFVS